MEQGKRNRAWVTVVVYEIQRRTDWVMVVKRFPKYSVQWVPVDREGASCTTGNGTEFSYYCMGAYRLEQCSIDGVVESVCG